MTRTTATAGTARHRLSVALAAGVESPAEHTAWMAGHIAETFDRELHRAGREELTKRLAAVEQAAEMVAYDLTEAQADALAADALDQPTPDETTRAAHLLTTAAQLLRPLLALLRRLVTARAGGNRSAAANAEAAGRALDNHTRAALVALALAAPALLTSPEPLAALVLAALVLLALALALITQHRRAEHGTAPARLILRRVLPTRAPPSRRAVTATV